MTDPNIGTLLSNRYRLVDLAGKGAMGRVYRAEDVLLGGVIAVKFLATTLLNAKMRDRFKREAQTCAQLGQKSIHIVRVMDYGVNEEDVPFYVMEFLQGDSLGDAIGTPPLMLPRFLSLARQICLGLQCAHQGILVDGLNCPIIHRDIKPSNVLVSKDPSLGELVKILDFGISKTLQADSDQTHSYMGTLAYSSPEQMEGKELDSRSDIYSLGIMLYEMLTGRMPLQAETHSFGGWYKAHHFQPPRTFSEVNPTLRMPKALETLVMSCLAKTPDLRPQSIADILKALQPLEERFTANRQIGNRIGEALARNPYVDRPPIPETPTKASEVCQRETWPKDKPIAQIVFAQSLPTPEGTFPTLWVMLPQQEIQNFQINKLYNKIYKNLLCTMSPHPMVLWLTAVYNKLQSREGPRWLRCYLDLKTGHGQEMTRLLGQKGQYQILLFALEDPQFCAHVMSVKLPNSQCSLLKEWAITSQSWQSLNQPATSKNLLNNEFEKLKPRIAAEMETHSIQSSLEADTEV
jgi:eukaryotic-like serine/threonine-protein kinase